MRRPKSTVGRVGYEEFLERYAGIRAEWVDGEVVELGPASYRHQDLVGFLGALLRGFVEARALGVVQVAPFQMKTGPDLAGREPDLLFVATERLGLLKETHLDGPADLVVEVASPESRLRDRGEKFAEYELGGVREYWLLDPDARRADFWVLGPDGRFDRRQPDAGGTYRSVAVPGFWLRVDWLFQRPLPRLLDVQRELGLF